jgi:methylated-DNA-[protein]-cysteine S-methyltransferase
MGKKIFTMRYSSPCGELLLGSFADKLCLCNWTTEKHPGRIDKRLKTTLHAEYEEAQTDITIEATRQLDEYFHGGRKTFDIPLLTVGTDFQKEIWNELLAIPYGETVSYGKLSVRIGKAHAVRAVANANGANAISIFIPCHRVIGSNRSLTGYGGGLDTKKFLLDLEQAGIEQT